jgi:hypothetical protein
VLRAWPLLLILLAPAQPSAFDPPPPGTGGTRGARARFTESLFILQERLDRNPADADAIERLLDVSRMLGRSQRVVPVARKALEVEGLDEKVEGRIRGLLGIALVAEANATRGFGNIVIIINGRQQRNNRRLNDEQRKLFVEAESHLRAGLKHASPSVELLDALAETIDALHGLEEATKEAEEFRNRADAIRMKSERISVGEDPFRLKAGELITEAEQLEQVETNPDHMRALEKRKQALVLAFCADTIPFDFAATLYEQVVLLAPSGLVNERLTRTFQNSKKQIEYVAPRYHGAPLEQRLKLIGALGKDGSNAADAALLALIRGAPNLEDPLARAAIEALRDGDHESARTGLPLLLAKSLYAADLNRFPVAGQRLLVQLAVELKCTNAADVLATMLDSDRDLYWPRRIAWALGRLGDSKHVRKLRLVAKDPRRDIAFRREAARAFALLADEAIMDLERYPELAIAVAAARYEKGKDENSLGRLLNGFANDLEIDEAARYCAELGIREAIPPMQVFLQEFGEKKDHPARRVVERELARLSRAR